MYGDPETPLQVGQIGQIRGTVSNAANGNGVAGDTVFVDLNHERDFRLQFRQRAVAQCAGKHSSESRDLYVNSYREQSRWLDYGRHGHLEHHLSLRQGSECEPDKPQRDDDPTLQRHWRLHANFTNTTLDDNAGTSILSGSAPFSGTYQPSGGLAQLNGEQPNGTWTLEVQSRMVTAGTLNSWSLHIASAEPSAVTAADGSYTIPNLPDGTFDVRHVPQAGWTDTNPASSVQQVTISNGDIVSNVNYVTEHNQPPSLAGIEAGR